MRNERMALFRATFDIAPRSTLAQLGSFAASLRGPLLLSVIYFFGAEVAFCIGTLSDKIFALFWPPNSGIEVDLEISPELDRLPPEAELVLFRVVQEALSNVARHSRSATARIRLDRESTASGQSAVLIIEDAGKGMPEGDRVRR